MQITSKRHPCNVMAAVILALCYSNIVSADGSSIEISNTSGMPQVIYLMVDSPVLSSAAKAELGLLPYPCIYPSDSFSGDGNSNTTCNFTLPDGQSQPILMSTISDGKIILAISAGDGHFPKGPCNTSLAEFTLNDAGVDGYDISLVNGRSFDLQIQSDNGRDITLNSKDPKQTLGVFPVGCSRCVDGIGVAPNFAGNGTSTQNCPGFGRKPGPMPTGSCKTGGEFTPKPNKCEIDSVPSGGNYVLTFAPSS